MSVSVGTTVGVPKIGETLLAQLGEHLADIPQDMVVPLADQLGNFEARHRQAVQVEDRSETVERQEAGQ